MGVKGFTLDPPPSAGIETDELQHLLVWYQDIRNRAAFGYKYEPIRLGEIEVYERFLAKSGLAMTAFDWDMLFRLDWLWMDVQPKDAPSTRPSASLSRA